MRNVAIRSLLCLCLAAFAACGGPEAVVEGDLATWRTLTLNFQGPRAHETGSEPNPFLDFRLQVHVTGPSGQTYNVPGFFDGDGQGGAGRQHLARPLLAG